MPEFDLNTAMETEPKWVPWDVFQHIEQENAENHPRYDWVSRTARYWISADETVLAKTTVAEILRMGRQGYLDMLLMTVPTHSPNARMLSEVAQGYNWYEQVIHEVTVAEQWMMTWAFYDSLPGRVHSIRISREEFNSDFPTHA